MRSIKPGRGPSAMGAMGSAFAIIFGVFWTIMAASMGAPIFFPILGVIFIGMGVVQLIYHYKNATGKNRMSMYDITEAGEETDPLDQVFGVHRQTSNARSEIPGDEKFSFCPYCGYKLDDVYRFCPSCGKPLKH